MSGKELIEQVENIYTDNVRRLLEITSVVGTGGLLDAIESGALQPPTTAQDSAANSPSNPDFVYYDKDGNVVTKKLYP